MNKLTAIKIKYNDDTYSDEIPVSVLSENVEWDKTHTLVDVLGSIDVDAKGTLQDQIDKLFNEKANASEYNSLVNRIDNLSNEKVSREKLALNISDFLPLNYSKKQFEKNGGTTTVWYSIIPSQYKPKLHLANDTINTVETAIDNANRNHTTITVNAGLFDMSNNTVIGYLINNKEVLNTVNYSDPYSMEYLYMTSDGILNSVGPTNDTSLDQLKNLNPEWAVLGFYPIVKNGNFLNNRVDDEKNPPRTFIGQDNNGRYIVGVSGGRNEGQKGLSMKDIYDFCLNEANFIPYFLYNLDGGGSSAFIYKGTRMNPLTQGENRACCSFISFEKEDTRILNAFQTINPINEKIADISTYLYQNIDRTLKVPKLIPATISDCNNVYETSISVCLPTTPNFPIDNYGFLITFRADGRTAQQIAMDKDYIYFRELYYAGDDYLTIIAPEWKCVYSPAQQQKAVLQNGIQGELSYAQDGHTVICYCFFHITSEIKAYTVLANKLPNGYRDIQYGFLYSGSTKTFYPVYTTPQGELINQDPLPEGYYRISLSYFSN